MCWPQQHPYLILSDYWVQLSLPTRYSYMNCGKTNYKSMNYFQFICNKNGISCFRPFSNHHKSRWTERLFASMLATFRFMDSVTAVNKPMEPVYTFTPQTVTTKHLVNFCVHHQMLHTVTTDNTKVGALCSYIVVQAVQEGHMHPQYNYK